MQDNLDKNEAVRVVVPAAATQPLRSEIPHSERQTVSGRIRGRCDSVVIRAAAAAA
ncbi:hypothetical protein GCM10009630_46180 [Kribbella jejuensis]